MNSVLMLQLTLKALPSASAPLSLKGSHVRTLARWTAVHKPKPFAYCADVHFITTTMPMNASSA